MIRPMSFAKFEPVDISQAPAEIAFVRELAMPGTPERWIEMAEHAFVVLHASRDLKNVKRRDLASCALEVAYEIGQQMGGEQYVIRSARKLRRSLED